MPGTYAIAAVAKITGLSIDTLRAWERRYAIVTPSRDELGVRRYSEKDIARLDLARTVTALGHPIRQVATLTDEQLLALIRDAALAQSAREQSDEPVIRDVLKAIRRYDIARAEQLLGSAALLLAPDRFIVHVLAPLMRKVGTLWELRQISIAQEHLVSNLVRNIVGTLARLHPATGAAPLIFATPPGEPHEFGIVFAACLASMRGVPACVLGPNVPAAEVLRASRYVNPQIVVIGATLTSEAAEYERYLLTLDAKLGTRIRLWAGGEGMAAIAGRPERVEYLATLDDFARRLSARSSA